MNVDTRGTEGGDDGENVVWGPTGHKCTKNQRYGFQCLSCSIFSFQFLLFLLSKAYPLANFIDEILPLCRRRGGVLDTGGSDKTGASVVARFAHICHDINIIFIIILTLITCFHARLRL